LDIAKKEEKRVQYMEQREGRLKIMLGIALHRCDQGVTKICRLSWLTNSVSCVYEPKIRGGGGVVAGSQPMSTAVHRSPINFGDLTPYLTYGCDSCAWDCEVSE
jgi:hypothetical protein